MGDKVKKLAYGIVRSADGTPKFDDPKSVPQPVRDSLTVEDLKKMDPGIVRTLGLGHKLEEK